MMRFRGKGLKSVEKIEKALGIRIVTPKELLGRELNEYERKYAPKVLYVAGSMEIPIPGPRISIVGTRQPTQEGIEATRKITEFLVKRGIIIVSGLARGIDTVAHKTAIELGGRTIAVLGTPLNRFYPPENKDLQKLIMEKHLAISQYRIGQVTRPKHFVMRNRTMALISDATIIVEAGETSGVISQGWETLRLGKPLILWNLLAGKDFKWVKDMKKYGAITLDDVKDLDYVIELLPLSVYEDKYRIEDLVIEL